MEFALPGTGADCLCAHRKVPYTELPSYPLWQEKEDNLAKLRKHGYFVVKGLLTNQEVEETKAEISRIVSGWYEKQQHKTQGDDGLDWEEIANRFIRRCTLVTLFLNPSFTEKVTRSKGRQSFSK